MGQIKPLAAYKGQTFGYALVGADAAAFSISSKGAITVTNALALNFETKPTYNFQVEVIDTTAGVLPAGTKSTINVTVNVVNVNDAAVITVKDAMTRRSRWPTRCTRSRSTRTRQPA